MNLIEDAREKCSTGGRAYDCYFHATCHLAIGLEKYLSMCRRDEDDFASRGENALEFIATAERLTTRSRSIIKRGHCRR